MTATLPPEVQQVFASFLTTEFTTVDGRGQPVTWPVTPYYRPGAPCIDLTTGVGYPKKADDARANSRVALLFSDSTGSGLVHAPQVLVQGTAQVDEDDLHANRERYRREAVEKVPALRRQLPPPLLNRVFGWYLARIYIHVRPERIYLWPDGDPSREPRLFDAHLEEVRSGHDEEPAAAHAAAEGGAPVWDDRLEQLAARYRSGAVSLVAPDGFPFSVRLPIEVDRERRHLRLGGAPVGVPWQPGLACLTVHDHSPEMKWQRNFQVRGDLVEEDGAWALVPHKLVGGLELPRGVVARLRLNAGKFRRFGRVARRRRNAKRPGKPGR